MTQTHLPRHLQSSSKNSDDRLENILVKDNDIEFYWCLLSVDIRDEEHCTELLKAIVQFWVTTRGYAVTSSWMEAYKKASQKTTKAL